MLNQLENHAHVKNYYEEENLYFIINKKMIDELILK
jgi:hypothetical protein